MRFPVSMPPIQVTQKLGSRSLTRRAAWDSWNGLHSMAPSTATGGLQNPAGRRDQGASLPSPPSTSRQPHHRPPTPLRSSSHRPGRARLQFDLVPRWRARRERAEAAGPRTPGRGGACGAVACRASLGKLSMAWTSRSELSQDTLRP